MKLIPDWIRRDAASGEALVELQQPEEIEMTNEVRSQGGEGVMPADPEQEVMMQAAAAHHRAVNERGKLVRLVDEATAALKAKNDQLLQMEAANAEERTRTESYRMEADDHVRQNARLGEGLANVRATLLMLVAQLDALALPAPPEKRRRRKSNGDVHVAAVAAVSEAMPHAIGSQGTVAEGPPVLAHGAEVLGQRSED